MSNPRGADRAFIQGRQIRLEPEKFKLVEKFDSPVSGAVKVGWKTKVGVVSYKPAKCALRGNTLHCVVNPGSPRAFTVVIPLDGSSFEMEQGKTVVIKEKEVGQYFWLRCDSRDQLRNWYGNLCALGRAEVNFNDFEILKAVGKGGMGQVFLAKHKRTGERLALKVIDKKNVFDKEGHLDHMIDERVLLEMGSDHPFVLKLRYAFQTDNNFFLATEFCEGGDLYHLLRRRRKTLSEDACRFVATEVILALESMHRRGCVYRDLKPDNVLLDSDGHIRLADFGLAKLLQKKPDGDGYERTNSFCGTAQYTPPEMIQKKYYGHSVDMWCLGVFLYEVIEGSTPFYTKEREQMYRRIERDDVQYSKRFSDDFRDLINRLLEKNPRNRYTLSQVKQHRWFENVNWDKVMRKEYWSRGVYTSKEKKEVALEDLRIINTERYKNLTVDEEKEIQKLRRFGIGPRKMPTNIIPGFDFTSPEILEEEKRLMVHISRTSGSGKSEGDDNTNISTTKVSEAAPPPKRRFSLRSTSFIRPSRRESNSVETPRRQTLKSDSVITDDELNLSPGDESGMKRETLTSGISRRFNNGILGRRKARTSVGRSGRSAVEVAL